MRHLRRKTMHRSSPPRTTIYSLRDRHQAAESIKQLSSIITIMLCVRRPNCVQETSLITFKTQQANNATTAQMTVQTPPLFSNSLLRWNKGHKMESIRTPWELDDSVPLLISNHSQNSIIIKKLQQLGQNVVYKQTMRWLDDILGRLQPIKTSSSKIISLTLCKKLHQCHSKRIKLRRRYREVEGDSQQGMVLAVMKAVTISKSRATNWPKKRIIT